MEVNQQRKENTVNHVISTGRIPIKVWADYVEHGASEQARRLSNLPFAFKHISLMPDVHVGYGMPIGGVMATRGAVCPNAVGVDISCGVAAVKTSLTEIDREALKKLLSLMRRDIPIGRNWHTEPQRLPYIEMDDCPVVREQYGRAKLQLGTLGGGNHHEQISMGSDGYVWIMVHSGSRNLGKQVADHYNAVARDLNKTFHSSVPDSWQLAFLPKGTDEFDAYMAEMNYCVEFAYYSRRQMLEIIKGHLYDMTNCGFEATIDISHNYAAMEHHFGKNVLVHRKGATRAYKNEPCIILGSQGTSSYIVRGKGESQSFKSCSHGAGRTMGRRAAKESLDLAAEVKFLEDQGILHSIRGKEQLDEATSAYKDIDVVMANQEDLVEIVVELSPLAVVKG